ncbi:MAG: serine protein kinase PrkA [Deltaproteobacteria bacterium]|nr:MAG: serine protein kinase PrkA [Deltaproteobacteria bacterium]
MDPKGFLEEVAASVRGRFVEDRSILSFPEYLAEFMESPRRHARSAAMYLAEVFDHFGTETRATPVGDFVRYRLFDLPWAEGRGRVSGQEAVQQALYRILKNFVRQGKVDRLILLHGPNGSAKSSLVSAMMAGLEAYSRTPEGAVYRFHWVFPREKVVKGSLGFGGARSAVKVESYAHLDPEDIETRIGDELRDHPLLLIPKDERRRLLERACRPARREEADDGDFVLPEYLLHGDLSAKNRAIYDALMASYGGDWSKVIAHVQVERFYYSRHYLNGCVTVEPQMSVDAGVRAWSVDRSAASIPPALQNVNLLEAYGPLVNANRGLLEFSDILKRPLEAFKYLLGTSETGEVRMEHLILRLDTVLVATSNEMHLSAFKELPDWTSFKGRMELVRVPYLRRFSDEIRIYEDQVTPATVGKHIAPHAVEIAAKWAVLTRLKKPQADRYPEEVRPLVGGLTPMDKLRLYDTGEPPARLNRTEAKALLSVIEQLYHESDTYPNYEGRTGASAREIKTVLFNAAQNPARQALTAGSVLEELEALVQDKSLYAFLQQEVVDGYHDHERFIGEVREAWIDEVDAEVRDAAGLVAEEQFVEWFGRYVQHVTAWVRGEKVHNRITGEDEPPNEKLMEEMEAIVKGEEEPAKDFRESLISAIGAYRLEHPDEEGELDYRHIFPELFRKLKDHYHEEQKRRLRRLYEDFLAYTDEEERGRLDRKAKEQVESMLQALYEKYGYRLESAREAIVALMRARYQD